MNYPNVLGNAPARIGTLRQRMRIVVTIVVVATLVGLLVTAQAKGCHYNVHLKTRLVCSK